MPLYPLYRDVQLRYGDELEREHRTKHAQVAALEFEARETTSAAALEAVRRRAEGQAAAREAEAAAEQQVQELERERLHLLEMHHRQLREIQERIESERIAADQRMREIEEETQALYGQCEADILRINAERDAATRAARGRCAQAERMGDEASRSAEQFEREVMAQARKAQAEEEQRRAWRVMETERRCEAWRKHCEEAVLETQRCVAERLEDLLVEASGARESLAVNRERADKHLEYDLDRKREAIAEEIAGAKTGLVAARQRLHNVRASASEMTRAAAAECERCEERQAHDLHDVADEVEAHLQGLSKLEAMDKPIYVQRLEELAMRLRSGGFFGESAPKPKAPSAEAAGADAGAGVEEPIRS
mmetsp:Transcript_15736/g.31895  ORF Transcript_15736/g.31895 Transcript_15736/m.31895 type:complete len:365 (-) Transcript_15736:82-1176(-)